jgi:hypothetical protein
MPKWDIQALGQRLEHAVNQYLTTHKKRWRIHPAMFFKKLCLSQNPKEGGEKDGMVSFHSLGSGAGLIHLDV